MRTAAILIFVAMYVLMTIFTRRRVWIVLAAAAVFLVFGILPPASILPAMNWNVLLMIAGTMVIVDFFISSRMPNYIADILLDKASNVCWLTVFMSLFAGMISAFIDNVATVLMVAPVGLAVCKKLKISPVPMILSIAVSSNLQGAATLVGDTTSIMLGAYAGMDFLQFFWIKGHPGIFFAVELGALATIPIMLFLFRREKAPIEAPEKTEVEDFFPSAMLVLLVVLLIAVSFVKNKPDVTNGLICCGLAFLCILYDVLRKKSWDRSRNALLSIDLETLALLLGLFLVIQGITEAGVISLAADGIVRAGGDNLFLLYSIIVWGSVLLSGFIDNIPYVATMLPVITGICAQLGIEPYLLYFGLLSGATLGGNLTPIGASANITASGILKKAGYEVSFPAFARIGIPFTLTAVTVGYVFIWLVWA